MIIKPTPDDKQVLREWLEGLEDSRLQRRVRDALKPLLEEAPWTGRDRKLWEAVIAPLDGGSTAPVAQRLQARLQFIRKRTEMLAKDYCTERAKWIVWSKVNDISDVLMGYYKQDGEAAVPEEPENANKSSDNGRSTPIRGTRPHHQNGYGYQEIYPMTDRVTLGYVHSWRCDSRVVSCVILFRSQCQPTISTDWPALAANFLSIVTLSDWVGGRIDYRN